MATAYPSFQSFPRTEPPPAFTHDLVAVFAEHRPMIDTIALTKGLTSDRVLTKIRKSLEAIGFEAETGKRQHEKIERPVFYGAQGKPTLRYEIDAYHPEWRCGLEVEAGRAGRGNAIYRDLIQAMVMAQVDWLALAVPVSYKHKSNKRDVSSKDYDKACAVAEVLYGHSRFVMPYNLIVIGY